MTDSQPHYGGRPPEFRMDVQPIELIVSCQLDFCLGNVIKYIARHKKKGGIEDLRKARQYLDWRIRLAESGVLPVPSPEETA